MFNRNSNQNSILFQNEEKSSEGTIKPRNPKQDDATVDTTEKPSNNNNNNAPRSQKQEPEGSELTSLLNFVPNELNKFFLPTYHFRLNVVNDLLAFEGQFRGKNIKELPRVVVAETGASSFFIEDVTIDSYTGFSPQLRNQGASKITMKIIEPQGVQFLDRVFDASQAMGVSNWYRMPWVLDLWFVGEDPQTGESVKISETRSWVINLVENKFSVNSKGSEYNITFVPYNEGAYNGITNIIDTNFDENVTTIGEFFEKLKNTLNESEKKKRTSPFKVPETTYDFVINNDVNIPGISEPINKWKITENLDVNSTRNIKFDAESNEETGTQIKFTKGIDIGKIVENVFATTKNGAMAISGSKDDQTTKQRDISHPYKYVPTVVPEVINDIFDDVSENWSRKVTFYIFMKRSPSNIDDPEELQKRKETGFQKNRIIKLNENKTLIKRYDYIFTGRNTEVLSFDISFDHLWFIPANWYNGHYTHENSSDGARFNEENDEQKKERLKREKVTRKSQQRVKENQDAISTFPPQQEEIKSQFVKESVESGLGEPSSEETRRALQSSQIQQQRARDRQESKAKRIRDTQSPITRIEDVERGIGDENRKIQISVDQEDSNPRVDVEQNIESDWKKAKTIFSSALHQIYGVHGELSVIDISIKGDPYWLGLPNSEKLTGGNINTNQNETSANDLYSEHQFLLLFGFPDRIQDPNTIKNHEFSSGIYNVSRVQSEFSNGKFTQNLQAYLDVKSDITKIDKSIFKG